MLLIILAPAHTNCTKGCYSAKRYFYYDDRYISHVLLYTILWRFWLCSQKLSQRWLSLYSGTYILSTYTLRSAIAELKFFENIVSVKTVFFLLSYMIRHHSNTTRHCLCAVYTEILVIFHLTKNHSTISAAATTTSGLDGAYTLITHMYICNVNECKADELSTRFIYFLYSQTLLLLCANVCLYTQREIYLHLRFDFNFNPWNCTEAIYAHVVWVVVVLSSNLNVRYTW